VKKPLVMWTAGVFSALTVVVALMVCGVLVLRSPPASLQQRSPGTALGTIVVRASPCVGVGTGFSSGYRLIVRVVRLGSGRGPSELVATSRTSAAYPYGHFRFHVSPGRYRVQAEGSPTSTVSTSRGHVSSVFLPSSCKALVI
jgi:hypothetical protein